MRKFLFILGALSLFAFMSCQQPTDSADNEPAWKQLEGWGSQSAKNMYQNFLGTWKNNDKVHVPEISTLILASDSVTVNSTKYEINQNTDLIYINNEEYDEFGNFLGIYIENIRYHGFYVRINNKLLSLSIHYPILTSHKIEVFYGDEKYSGCDIFEELDTNDSENGEGSEDVSSLNGIYTFNSATGSQSSGTITLTDGNFTYSGGKSNAPSSGTYTVSGSDITFSWTANGYSVSTTVTVSKDGSSVTLSSSEVLFFSTFFGSTAQSGGKYSLTFNYTE